MIIILEDGFSIRKGTGIGQHTLNLFHQLKRSPEIESVQLTKKPFLDKIPLAALRRALYITWLNSGLQVSLKRREVDIAHFTNYLIPTLRLTKAKYVVTIHDLAAYKFPQTLPPLYVHYIKRAIAHAIKKSDLICTVTNTVKNEIAETFNTKHKRIHVVHNGISQEFWTTPKPSFSKIATTKKQFGITDNFLLFVGTLEKRKNICTLLKAFKEVVSKRNDIQLVLMGKPGYGFNEVEEYLSKSKLGNSVILTGYVTEKEKILLYDGALALVFPSLYEGFGIPLVEAMAREIPIIASKIPSTKEVAGDVALYYNNPFDCKALTIQILDILNSKNLRQKLAKKSLKRSREFSWENIRKRYIQAYQELLEGDM